MSYEKEINELQIRNQQEVGIDGICGEEGGMRIITAELLEKYEKYLYREEKSPNTVKKYLCDLKKLMEYAGGREITKDLMIGYKNCLQEKKYKVTSINSFIVAANRFFEYMEWYGIGVKTLMVQPEVYCPEEKELTKAEYKKLVQTARADNKQRLAMIIMTICATGIRVSELSAITVSGVIKGEVIVNNKGKIRKVLIPGKLRVQLMAYIAEMKIAKGIVFCTKSGKSVSRTNIWRDMKKLCKKAGVNEEKVFPHNLRHLFARTYYDAKKDIAKLADIMGHGSIETTRIYLRCSINEYMKELDSLGLVV